MEDSNWVPEADPEVYYEKEAKSELGMYIVNGVLAPSEEMLEEEKYFFDNLYRAFVGEYKLISQLFYCGLDGTKLPTDFGYDIISTNQKLCVYDNDPNTCNQFWQVKTRWVDQWTNQLAERYVVKTFSVSARNMTKLIHESNAFLVCYFFDSESGNMVDSFWLSSYHLNQLISSQHIPVVKDKKATSTTSL